MRGTYTVTGTNITVANGAVPLIALRPPSSCSLEILRVWANQSSSTTSAQCRIDFFTQVSAFPTMVTTGLTIGKTAILDAASQMSTGTDCSAGKIGINAAAEGGGTITLIQSDAFNVLNGFLWVATPTETMQINAASSSIWGVRFPAAAPTLTGWNFGLTFREI